MKAKLIFNLPEDNYEYNLCRDAELYKSSLYEISEWLRQKIKYESDNLTEDEYKAYCECKDKLIEILNENKIDPYQG
jgi:hypothetical protein